MNIVETELDFGSLNSRKGTDRFILHHSATSDETVEQIHAYHKKKGWKGIGYHFYVRKDGNVYRGRPEYAVGSHAAGCNSDSIGICFEGNFETEIMSEAQKQAGKELINDLRQKYGVEIIQRHGEVGNTACPGRNFPFQEIIGKMIADEKKTVELEVDGRWGPAVTRRLQQIFGTTVDGKVSHQYVCYRSQNQGLSSSCWEWEEKPLKGSLLIKAMQKHLNDIVNFGLREDGHMGPKTIRALQNWMGTKQDGYFSQTSVCIRKLQEWANEQL